MNVWKSDEKVKLLIFASLISPSKIILLELNKYQVSDTVFVKITPLRVVLQLSSQCFNQFKNLCCWSVVAAPIQNTSEYISLKLIRLLRVVITPSGYNC